MPAINSLRILKQEDSHLGLVLPNDTEIKFPLTVITGRNGAGKTRLLARIKNNGIVDGVSGDAPSIRFFSRESLLPKMMERFTVEAHMANQRRVIKGYKLWVENRPNREYGGEAELTDAQVEPIANEIGKRIGKDPKQLSEEEILDHAPNFLQTDPFSNFTIGDLCNRYIFDYHVNRKNRGLAAVGENVAFFSPEEFVKHHGPEPWVILNGIMKDVFRGKFEFRAPNIDSRTFEYRPVLLERGKPIDLSLISTGEQMILWLALTLFNVTLTRTEKEGQLSVFLFDEPDAFLHPEMVATLYRVFASICEKFHVAIIFTSHSPTTVALAPEGSLFAIADGILRPLEVDEAISELLAGVPQISIDPAKQRHVFVESRFDAEIYQQIFVAQKRNLIPSISLNFLSAGAKIPKDAIKVVIRKHIKGLSDELLDQITEEINGQGDSSKVLAHVEAQISAGSRTVRGIVDWDKTNKPGARKYVSVVGHGIFYSIENWAIDPIGCVFMLNQIDSGKYPLCRAAPDLVVSEWLSNSDLLQTSLDEFILDVYGHKNSRSVDIDYINGFRLQSDPDHVFAQGHDAVEDVICKKFGVLKGVANSHPSRKLTCAIVQRFMIHRTEGAMIPKVVIDCLRELQLVD